MSELKYTLDIYKMLNGKFLSVLHYTLCLGISSSIYTYMIHSSQIYTEKRCVSTEFLFIIYYF